MVVLGHILGIIIVIFGVILLIGMIHYVLNFDFDAPIFKIDIKISNKTESGDSDKTEIETSDKAD